VEAKRAPDPFRPGEIPEGRPHEKVGRPGAAALFVGLIVLVAAAFVVWAVLR
jgi:hypothetical protein